MNNKNQKPPQWSLTEETTDQETNLPLVTIIITTYEPEEILFQLLESILTSKYPNNLIEIIVVEDSNQLMKSDLPSKKVDINLIKNDEEKLTSECRNIGIRESSGEYLLFIDDDNIIEKNCISTLVNYIKNNNVGVVAPFMLYLEKPDRIWCAGIERSYPTTNTTYIKQNEIYDLESLEPIEVDDVPNSFMIKREIIDTVGYFDSELFPIEHEHADFFERITNKGYKIVTIPEAIIWHQVEEDKNSQFNNPIRVLNLARNRIIYARIHMGWVNLVVFYFLLPIIVTYYLLKISKYSEERYKIINIYLEGVLKGILTPIPDDRK